MIRDDIPQPSVARCAPYGVQRATPAPASATTDATQAQRLDTKPDLSLLADAVLQRWACNEACNALETPPESYATHPDLLAWIKQATSELDRRAACTATCWNCGRTEDPSMSRSLYRDAGGFLACDSCFPRP